MESRNDVAAAWIREQNNFRSPDTGTPGWTPGICFWIHSGLGLASFWRTVDGTWTGCRASGGSRRRGADPRAGPAHPLQQLLGVQEFMGLEFFVNEHVLIPRQDTETLVELVLEERKQRDLDVLDVCTGSGCIAVSLWRGWGGYRSVTALDVSAEALKVAEKNAAALLGGVRRGFPAGAKRYVCGAGDEGNEAQPGQEPGKAEVSCRNRAAGQGKLPLPGI